MKKLLLLIILFLSCLTANAQQENDDLASVAKMTFEGIKDLSELGVSYSYQQETLEIVPDGLAIKNPIRQDVMWTPLLPVLGRIPLEEGHDYVLRLTLKVPSTGTYWLDMCSWSANYYYSRQVPVVAGDDFQIIDVEYPEYGRSVTDGTVFLGWGWVVGTTILKEVEVLERRHTADIQSIKVANSQNNDVFNLSGQKVKASYKGIVVQNGRLIINR